MNDELDGLVKAVDKLDPATLTASEVADVKAWAADKVGFILVDMDTQKILFATQGAEQIFGYMPDEMAGMDLVALVADEFKGVHPSHVSKFNANPTPRQMGRRDRPLRGRERDGSEFPVEIGLYPRKLKSLRVCLANVVRLSKAI